MLSFCSLGKVAQAPGAGISGGASYWLQGAPDSRSLCCRI